MSELGLFLLAWSIMFFSMLTCQCTNGLSLAICQFSMYCCQPRLSQCSSEDIRNEICSLQLRMQKKGIHLQINAHCIWLHITVLCSFCQALHWIPLQLSKKLLIVTVLMLSILSDSVKTHSNKQTNKQTNKQYAYNIYHFSPVYIKLLHLVIFLIRFVIS